MNEHDKKVMWSTGKDDWGTPKLLFNKLHDTFNFCVDVCASEENRLVDQWIGPGAPDMDTALVTDWHRACKINHAASRFYVHNFFMNPPYSDVDLFIQVMANDAAAHPENRYVALLAARTDTRWFHNYVLPQASEIMFVKGRVTFAGAPAPAPFPSMVVVYNTATSSKVDGYGAKITSWSYK